MQVNLKGYKGSVKKAAAVLCNDPQRPRTSLTLQANVRTLIDVRPKDIVLFKGAANKVSEKTIELVGTSLTFHITKIDTNLEDRVALQLETVEDGKHYRLRLTNLLKHGKYGGFVRLHTDLAEKSDIMIHVDGFIEGET